MPQYEYHRRTFDKRDGTIDLPDTALGVTVGYYGDDATVRYLAPVSGTDATTEYEYRRRTFDKHDGTTDLPDAARGVTVDYYGDDATVQYLVRA